ncbi:hypothetical protein Tco_1201808 [Tanacetum coccineum]
MPPRRFKKKSVRKIVEKRVARAIEKYEKTRTESNNAGGSGSANTEGTVAPEVQGCSYKTFMNGKPHFFSGTEGVVGLKRWFEKMEQVFEICKCAEDDKAGAIALDFWTMKEMTSRHTEQVASVHELVLMCPELVSTEKKKIEKYIRGFPEGIKGNVTSSKPATLHDAINMARELIEQGVQAKALRIGDSNKRKWEDQQGNNHHQQQNRRQEVAKIYVATPAKGRGCYSGNYHGAIGKGTSNSQVGTIAYRLELPQELSRVHHTFHVSNLKKCHVDEPLVVPLDGLHIDDKLYFIKENIEIRSQKVEAKLYPKLSRFVGTLGKELSIPGNMKTNSGRNIRIFSPNPYFHLVSQLEP